MDERSYIYLDYAATSPLGEEPASAMRAYADGYEGSFFANANSLHTPGRKAFEALEQARRSVAHDVGARRPDEIVFTSGATEADNAALAGMAHAARDACRRAGHAVVKPRIIVSAIEHDAVLMPAKRLESEGFEVVRLRPDRDGFITVRSLEDALTDDTLLVSVQMANSEIGSIQPIAELSRVAHAAGALFHTDAVQALGKAYVSFEELGVDAASLSAHKIGGPLGVGALYLKARTPFAPLIEGGGQEAARRSGTQNVVGAVGFAAACHVAISSQEDEAERLRHLRDYLYDAMNAFSQVEATVDVEPGSHDYLPNIVSVLVDGFESETLVLRLDELGFAVSGGSACASHSLEPSHVLKALGISADKAQGALRISMGRYTTESDVHAFVEACARALAWR